MIKTSIPRQDTEELQVYLKSLEPWPNLTRAQEDKLARRMSRGDSEAAALLLVSNLRFVVSQVLKYRRYGLPTMDLVAVGNEGALHAISKFKPKKGFRFMTYASWWIRSYVTKYILQDKSLVKNKIRSDQYFLIRREKAKLENLLGPDVKEIESRLCKLTNLEPNKLSQLCEFICGRDLSLDCAVHWADPEGGETTFMDMLEDPAPNPEQALIRKREDQERKVRCGVALGSLPGRQRELIERRLMQDPEDICTLAELGRDAGISRERARQIQNQAIKRMRRVLGSAG